MGKSMNRSYNEIYLDDAMSNLGAAFEVAKYSFGYAINDFLDIFIKSDVSNSFQKGNPKYVTGKSGFELVQDVLIKNNDMYLIQEPTPMYDYSKEYWCGWMYAYLQWYFNVSFKKLRNYLDMNDLQKLYPTLHEVSLHKAISTIKKYITNKNMPTNLQRLRLNHNISQSKLAEVSGVSLRMIQQYEQKQKDINKASVSSLYELAKALDCDIEDIMELNIDN